VWWSCQSCLVDLSFCADDGDTRYDQDFNPHNDRQAQDRAYRIGQQRDVDVVKFITRSTIEEDMLRLGETKLALDEAVAGDVDESDEKEESAQTREMKMSLMNSVRRQLEEQEVGEQTEASKTALAKDNDTG
jgi:SWI/SNF-related matrix-associated actin-dependent regulator 1 of chromatin subfamily A